MDGLDIRIVRAMGVMPYNATPRGPDTFKADFIARAVGVSPETVRKRLQRMEETGVIAGYEVFPNLHHLGLKAGGYMFLVGDEARRERIASDAALVDGLLDVFHFLGDSVCLDVCYRSEADLQRKLKLISGMTSDAPPDPFSSWVMPQPPRELDHLDWRIVQALRGRARTPLVDIAEDLGVSYRTVKRRYDRMADEGSIFTIPLLDPGKGDGMIPFVLLVYTRPESTKAVYDAILTILDDAYVFSGAPLSSSFGNIDFLAFAPTPQAFEALRQRVAKVPGVTRAVALLTTAVSHHGAWIDDLIAERVKASGR